MFVYIITSRGTVAINQLHIVVGIFIGERIPLVVFGMVKVKRIHISAVLSGLKLEADLQNVHTSATHRDRVKG